MRHIERHRTQRIGWLRAAVLGANDGIVSTAIYVGRGLDAGLASKVATQLMELETLALDDVLAKS